MTSNETTDVTSLERVEHGEVVLVQTACLHGLSIRMTLVGTGMGGLFLSSYIATHELA